MSKKLNVIIGICAYNEEKSIKNILLNVLSQKHIGYILKKIIVVSDGSSDNTVLEARAIKSPFITVLSDKNRKGKAGRLNDLFTLVKSDILVLLDADILLNNESTISRLVSPIIAGEADLTSGRILPRKSDTYFRSILEHGYYIVDKSFAISAHNDMYYCSGAIRAMSKKFYSKMRFPDIKAEDVFPFYYCVSHKMKFRYVDDAEVAFELPETIRAYMNQAKRYLSAKQELINIFGENLVSYYYSSSVKEKCYSAIFFLLKSPVKTLLYIFLVVVSYASSIIQKEKSGAVWNSKQI